MKNLVLDANVIVRFLVQDDPTQAEGALALMNQAEHGQYMLHWDGLVIAEIVYVLTGIYKRSRVQVAQALLALIQNACIETMEKNLVIDALGRFENTNVDFADAWLAARAAQCGYAVASFDRDLDKFKDIKRVEPR
jgi:predicted nucleic acid-binding protein